MLVPVLPVLPVWLPPLLRLICLLLLRLVWLLLELLELLVPVLLLPAWSMRQAVRGCRPSWGRGKCCDLKQ